MSKTNKIKMPKMRKPEPESETTSATPPPPEVAIAEQATPATEQPFYPYGDALQPRALNAPVSMGSFRLPTSFDSKRYAGNYVPDTDVASKQSVESLVGTGLTAPGWAPWKDPKTGEAHRVISDKRTYVLMFRPRKIQGKINHAFGQLSRSRLNAERTGETVMGSEKQDGGILTRDQLIPAERRMAQRLGQTFVGDDEENPHAAFYGEEDISLPAHGSIQQEAQTLNR